MEPIDVSSPTGLFILTLTTAPTLVFVAPGASASLYNEAMATGLEAKIATEVKRGFIDSSSVEWTEPRIRKGLRHYLEQLGWDDAVPRPGYYLTVGDQLLGYDPGLPSLGKDWLAIALGAGAEWFAAKYGARTEATFMKAGLGYGPAQRAADFFADAYRDWRSFQSSRSDDRQRRRQRQAAADESAVSDAYRLFELDHGADLSELKKARKRLALKAHPDRSTDDADRERRNRLMIEINAAYDVLERHMKRTKAA